MTGHHFAGFSNRFWKLLFHSGLVPEPLTYLDDDRLPEWGYGITNVVSRPTPGIDTLKREEYVAGAARLRRKIRRHRPPVVALVGVTVFRALFPARRGAVSLGLQKERLGDSAVFVLPRAAGTRTIRSWRCAARSARWAPQSKPAALASLRLVRAYATAPPAAAASSPAAMSTAW